MGGWSFRDYFVIRFEFHYRYDMFATLQQNPLGSGLLLTTAPRNRSLYTIDLLQVLTMLKFFAPAPLVNLPYPIYTAWSRQAAALYISPAHYI